MNETSFARSASARIGRRARIFLLLVSTLLLASTNASATLSIEQWRTSQGVKVLFVAASDIPMLDIELIFDAGSRLDPAGKTGVAGMTASLLDAGAGARDEAAVAEAFASLGARRSSGAGDDSASVRLRTLTDPAEFEGAIELFIDMIARPTFAENVVARERERRVQRIQESLERPGSVMSREFDELIYADHPYGRWSTVNSITALSRDDLVAFHHRNYSRARASIAMIGAITRQQAERLAERLVADLPQGEAGNQMPPVKPVVAQEKWIKHAASQSHIVVGAPLLARGDPDFFPMLVANHVLGGGSFVSRLYSEIRDKRGFAYSVSSGFSPRLQPGPFSITLQTRRENTDEALQVVREVLATFVRDGPTENELEAARQNLAGSFALSMDSNSEILGLIGRIGFFGLPLDWLDKWPGRVRAVSLAEVRDVLARRLHPEQMVTVVVGQGAPAN